MARINITIFDGSDGETKIRAEFEPTMPAEVKDFTPAQQLAAGLLGAIHDGAKEAGTLTEYKNITGRPK
jgi:hypothetical protein